MVTKKKITKSEKETFNFAKKFAKELKGGEVIALIGNLGAGKTVFTKGLAAGLGVKQIVNSPTFVLMKIYEIRDTKYEIRNLVHVDAYRVNDAQELIDIGLQDYMSQKDIIVIIEWADRVKKILPKNAIQIKISGQDEKRIIKIK